jgi:hypothetical protein
MGNWGIKVTKTGYDLGTASVQNQSLNSSKNTFKILKEGVASGTVTSSGTTVSVSVSDTFSSNTFPAFLGFMKIGTSNVWYPPHITEADSGNSIRMDLVLYPDKLQLSAVLSASSGTTPVTVYFYEMIEPSVKI